MESNCCSEPVSYAEVEDNGTSGLVIEDSDDSDKVDADVVLLHDCPQSGMPNPVEGLLEVYEDTVEVLLVRRLKICSVVLFPALKPACSLAMIFSACGFYLFSMIFSMTAWVADETDHSVVSTLMQVMTRDWAHGIGHSPVCQIMLQIVVRVVIMSSPPAWTSSARMLSTPTYFPFFSVYVYFCAKDRVVILCVRLGTVQY